MGAENPNFKAFKHPGSPEFFFEPDNENTLGQNTHGLRVVASTEIPVDRPTDYVGIVREESRKNKPVYLSFHDDDGEDVLAPIVAASVVLDEKTEKEKLKLLVSLMDEDKAGPAVYQNKSKW